MLHSNTFQIGRHKLLHVTVEAVPGPPVEQQAREAITEAVAEIERQGIPAGRIVRSRLWARDAAARTAASNVRLEVLAGDRRAASSSFIDALRLRPGSDMMIDLYALATPDVPGSKEIREYDPPIPPPQFVRLGGLLALSGDTDRSPGLEQQMASIRGKLDRSLADGGSGWDRVVSASVFLARRLPPGAGRAAFDAHFPPGLPSLHIATVEGYSNPEKLVEVEINADLG